VEEKKPYYESFAAGTQNYMNSISSTPEWFVGLLKEYQQKTNTPAEKKYIDDMIQVINNYNEINKKKI
jgi:hypothetical protein